MNYCVKILAQRKSGDYLTVKRLDTFDLPSGKINRGELPDSAARRVFLEETGILVFEMHLLFASTFWHPHTKEEWVCITFGADLDDDPKNMGSSKRPIAWNTALELVTDSIHPDYFFQMFDRLNITYLEAS